MIYETMIGDVLHRVKFDRTDIAECKQLNAQQRMAIDLYCDDKYPQTYANVARLMDITQPWARSLCLKAANKIAKKKVANLQAIKCKKIFTHQNWFASAKTIPRRQRVKELSYDQELNGYKFF